MAPETPSDSQSCKLVDKFTDDVASIDSDYYQRVALSQKKNTWILDVKVPPMFGMSKYPRQEEELFSSDINQSTNQ